MTDQDEKNELSPMDIHQIMEYLPHRYPFLLIDLGVVDITGLLKSNQIKSGFFTENLEGDSMEYWAAWLLVRDVLDFNIQNANEYP